MDYYRKTPPRVFEVDDVTIKDHGKVTLEPGDMITVTTKSGKECDITAMEWGIYLGSSINSRLLNEGFRVALVRNLQGKFFINAVEIDKIDRFKRYLKSAPESELVCWLGEA
jgi:hypothetical protein